MPPQSSPESSLVDFVVSSRASAAKKAIAAMALGYEIRPGEGNIIVMMAREERCNGTSPADLGRPDDHDDDLLEGREGRGHAVNTRAKTPWVMSFFVVGVEGGDVIPRPWAGPPCPCPIAGSVLRMRAYCMRMACCALSVAGRQGQVAGF